MTRANRIVFFCVLSLGGLTSVARANDACAPDRARLCKGVRGRRARAACINGHEAELSAACKAQRAAVTQAAENVHASCQADVDKVCQGIKPGRGRIHACLKSHATDVSPACNEAMASIKELKESIHPGCRPDAEKLCQGIRPGGGRVMACLQSHQSELSQVCKVKLEKHVARRAQRRAAREAAKSAAQ
jgi:hypothetical protein